jgi:hypothetical protein
MADIDSINKVGREAAAFELLIGGLSMRVEAINQEVSDLRGKIRHLPSVRTRLWDAGRALNEAHAQLSNARVICQSIIKEE